MTGLIHSIEAKAKAKRQRSKPELPCAAAFLVAVESVMAENEITGNGSTGAEVQGTDEGTLNPGPPPQITIKPGWAKSEGQLAGIFTILSIILAFLGFKFSPDKIENVYELIRFLAQTFGPLVITGFGVLKTYINSRGKVTSNGLWATASMNSPLVLNDNILQPSITAQAGTPLAGSVPQVSGLSSREIMALVEYGKLQARNEMQGRREGDK